MFRPVVGEIFGAWAPKYMEVSQLNSILDPVESHVDCSRSLLLPNVIGDVVGSEIVRDHHGRWLWVC